jgi:hypothetical protein
MVVMIDGFEIQKTIERRERKAYLSAIFLKLYLIWVKRLIIDFAKNFNKHDY